MSEASLRQRLAKPRTKHAKRVAKDRAPKVIEDPKRQLLLRGTKTSPITNEVLADLHKLKAPYSVSLNRRTDKRPFDDFSSVSFLSNKNDCSLFAFGSNNKKRPHNIVFGRMFDYNLVDMFEFGIDQGTYRSIKSFQSVFDHESNEPNVKSFSYGSKPALLFQGESFDNDPILKEIKSFFIDYFNGEAMKKLNLLTLDHVIVFSAINLDEMSVAKHKEYRLEHNGNGSMIMFRHYKIESQTSSHNKVPFVHLSEIGPSMDLTLRRYEKGNDEIIKQSNAKQVQIKLLNKKPKQKNVFLDQVFKERRGRLYIEQKDQNINKLKTKKMKALRDRNRSKKTPRKKKNSNNRKNRNLMNQDM